MQLKVTAVQHSPRQRSQGRPSCKAEGKDHKATRLRATGPQIKVIRSEGPSLVHPLQTISTAVGYVKASKPEQCVVGWIHQ